MFEWLEEDFVQMQGKFWLFFFEAIVTLYLMLSQGVIAEKFLMKSLENITHRYNLSQSIAGILIAFGVAVPEVVVTILSFQKHGIKMTEFGVATILGSVCFATCFIPAIAHLTNYGLKHAKPLPTEIEFQQNKLLLGIFLRDMSFTISGLLLLYYFLEAGSIKHKNLTVFMIMFFAYAILLVMQSTEIVDEKGLRKKNEHEMSAEDLSVPQDIEETALLTLEPRQPELCCNEKVQQDQSYVKEKD